MHARGKGVYDQVSVHEFRRRSIRLGLDFIPSSHKILMEGVHAQDYQGYLMGRPTSISSWLRIHLFFPYRSLGRILDSLRKPNGNTYEAHAYHTVGC